MSSFSGGQATLLGTQATGTGTALQANVSIQAQDGQVAQLGLWTNSEIFYFNPGTAAVERARTMMQLGINTAQPAAAGLNPIWTPQAGKRFRLMALSLEVDANASLAVAGQLNLTFQDGGTSLGGGGLTFHVALPAAAGPTGPPLLSKFIIFPGNGYLALGANDVLNLNIGTALVTGRTRVNTWGTEE